VPSELLGNLLREVSRSFYLTVRLLPRAVRCPVGVGYLLARTTDTIADTALAPLEDRLAALAQLRSRILGEANDRLDFSRFAAEVGVREAEPGRAAEEALLLRVEEALGVLNALPEPDVALIREVLRTITSGQELDLQRFGRASAEEIVSLQSDDELDDYTYRVAGCVGEFWTKLCRRHLFGDIVVDERLLLKSGVRFGKGLQLVNVLRDLPRDLRQGRCYLPEQVLTAHGVPVAALLNPSAIGRFRTVYDGYLQRAEDHLRAGWDYTNALPRGQVRLRLACALPVLIGVRTIGRLRTGNVLDASLRIKITRAEVRRLMLRSAVCYPSAAAWEKLFDRARH
jgi:farnesyl-diphosphate farnesyltransferase